jgi:hypothetical protein
LPVYAGQRVTPAVLEGASDLAGLTTGSVTNSTTETAIGTFTAGYPGGDGGVNTGYTFYITGTFDTTGTPTITFNLYMASVAAGNQMFGSGALTTGGTNTSEPYWIVAFLVINGTGVSGTFDSGGWGQAANAASANMFQNNRAAKTIDTTTTHDVVFTAKWSASSSSNTCRTTGGQMSKM